MVFIIRYNYYNNYTIDVLLLVSTSWLYTFPTVFKRMLAVLRSAATAAHAAGASSWVLPILLIEA